MIKVITHDGKFHPDEIFASVILSYFTGARISFLRTRNETKLNNARHDRNTYLIDVGGVYDPFMRNFDHHQASFNELGDAGQVLSSCGLIWRYLRDDVDLPQGIKDRITEFTVNVDKLDNGQAYFEAVEFVSSFNSSPKKNRFIAAFRAAYNYFDNLMHSWKHLEEISKHEDEALAAARNGVIFSEQKLSVSEKLNRSENKVLVCKRAEGEYSITSLNVGIDIDFSVRCPAPAEWAGLLEEQIKEIDPRLVFCHKNLFLTIVKGTQKDAIEIARKIVNDDTCNRIEKGLQYIDDLKEKTK